MGASKTIGLAVFRTMKWRERALNLLQKSHFKMRNAPAIDEPSPPHLHH
jgi:hypothetical protein